MLEIPWDSSITTNPLLLADAVELTLAFDHENCSGRFTRANFQHLVDTENLGDSEQSYLGGDLADERNLHFDQILTLVERRALWLGASYPFRVNDGEIRFSVLEDCKHCLPYLFLLVCSNANFVPSLKATLPDQFEVLCKEAIRPLFPHWAEVLLFSQKSDDRKNIFGYAARDAVATLAGKLNARLNDASLLPDTQREFGIDIVVICPFGDQSPYPFFAFAQCTTQQDWWEKRHEALASTALTGFVNLAAQHSNFLMIPHFPRYSLEEWSEDPSRTGNCILWDRLRICMLLERSERFRQGNLPSSIAEVFQKLEGDIQEE